MEHDSSFWEHPENERGNWNGASINTRWCFIAWLPLLCVTVTVRYRYCALPLLCVTVTVRYRYCALPLLCVTVTVRYRYCDWWHYVAT